MVASGLGDDTGGGIFVLGDEGIAALDRLSTTGLAVSHDGERLARLSWADADPRAAADLLVYDRRGILCNRRVDALQEPHGALWADDVLIVVSTFTNSILWLDECGSVMRRWSAPGDGDAWHINGILPLGGRLLATAFGRFAAHRGWAKPGASVGSGIVFDVHSGATVLDGLTYPHDPVFLDGTWLVCNSGTQELLRVDTGGAVRYRQRVAGWPRGLTYDERHVYVGVSAHRMLGAHGTAHVVALDRGSLIEEHRWTLPCREVFALAFVPRALVEGVHLGMEFDPSASRSVDRLVET